MATSGSWDYSLTAANIIDMAVENLQVLASGGTIVAADQTLALRRLNVIAKQHQGTADGAPGLKVHTRQRVTLFLAKGQQSYLVGPASTDARASTAIGRTTIDAAEASGQTVISVAATVDSTTYPGTTITMATSDFVAVEQDNGVLHWSTASTLSVNDTVTLANALSDSAAVGNYVYWFTARAQRFPIIESARLRDENRIDTPLTIYRTAQEYDDGVADKYADGSPTAILVEPLRIATRVTLDSQPTDVTDTIEMTVLYPAEDYDATTNDIAFPQEALRFLSWELSFEIHPAFGVTWTPGMEKLRQEARASWMNLNPEVSSLCFEPGAAG
jgi:hypothetical protein